MIVTHLHFRTIPARRGRGYCCSGGRAWFKRHGLSWADFVRHGIDEDRLTETGDGMAQGLVAWARECEAAEQGRG